MVLSGVDLLKAEGSMMSTKKDVSGVTQDSMISGTLHREYKRCGRATCLCAHGRLHGPYYYVHTRDGNRQRKHYVRLADVAAVKAQLEERHTLAVQRREQKQQLDAVGHPGWQEYRRLVTVLREVGEVTNEKN